MSDDIKNDSILTTYQKELENDLKLDRVGLEEQQLKVPSNKGKWVARLINHRKEIDKLTDLYDDAIDQIATKIVADSPVGMSKIAAQKIAENHELAKKIKKEMKDQQRIVEYLEKMEKVLSSMTYDITNIINLMKLEIT